MTITIELSDLANLSNPTTAVTTINTNNELIEGGFNTAYNTTGDQLLGTMDANSNQIINLPAPSTVNSPARLVDVVTNPTITVPPTGTSGHFIPYLDGNNTWSANQSISAKLFLNSGTTATAIIIQGTDNSSQDQGGQIQMVNTGSTAATPNKYLRVDHAGEFQLLNSNYSSSLVTISDGGNATFAATVTTPTINATNASFTTVTAVTANFTGATAYAASGKWGEFNTSTGSSVGMTSATPTVVTSLALGAGLWLVGGGVAFTFGGTATTFNAGIFTNSASFSTAAQLGQYVSLVGPNFQTVAQFNVGPYAYSTATASTVYFNVQNTFSSACTATATINAWRIH